jgi:dTDP-glucose pyrophosphorylase
VESDGVDAAPLASVAREHDRQNGRFGNVNIHRFHNCSRHRRSKLVASVLDAAIITPMIASVEEIAWRPRDIVDEQVERLAHMLGKIGYGMYLRDSLRGE